MPKPRADDADKNHDLFANGSPVAQSNVMPESPNKNPLNAYAEASQAFATGRTPVAIRPCEARVPDQNPGMDTKADIPVLMPSAIESVPATSPPASPDTARSQNGKIRTPTKEADCTRQNPPRSRMMTVGEVADYLHVSISKIWRLEKGKSKFPKAVRIEGNTRWDRKAIDRYLDELCGRG